MYVCKYVYMGMQLLYTNVMYLRKSVDDFLYRVFVFSSYAINPLFS